MTLRLSVKWSYCLSHDFMLKSWHRCVYFREPFSLPITPGSLDLWRSAAALTVGREKKNSVPSQKVTARGPSTSILLPQVCGKITPKTHTETPTL